jgi:hypothetical protein
MGAGVARSAPSALSTGRIMDASRTRGVVVGAECMFSW